jgi:hypothetical protein
MLWITFCGTNGSVNTPKQAITLERRLGQKSLALKNQLQPQQLTQKLAS